MAHCSVPAIPASEVLCFTSHLWQADKCISIHLLYDNSKNIHVESKELDLLPRG